MDNIFLGESNPANPDKIILDKVFIIAAEKAIKEFNYGDVISKQWLLEQFGIEMPEIGTQKDFNDFSFEFLQNMEGFKNYMLTQHKMLLVSVRGIGYEIVLPKHQSDYAMTRFKNNLNFELKKAIDTILLTNEAQLSHEDIKRRDSQHGKIAAIAAFTEKRISYKK
jgi:hypothetical protein